MATRALCLALALLPGVAFSAASIQAPATVGMGASIEIAVTGRTNRRDFVTIVPKDVAMDAYQACFYLDKPGKLALACAAP